MRDDMGLKFTDEELEKYPYVMPADVPELVAYAKSRRDQLNGFMPKRCNLRSTLLTQHRKPTRV